MNLLPAILIGGPPNCGKSILFHSLTRALESRNLPSFYALRAAPDGEGHWAQEVSPERLGRLRFKGEWNQYWVDVTCRDLAARSMPMLVDIGGKPTLEQEAIFDQCSYAILLARQDDEPSRNHWRAMLQAHGLPILADIRSHLSGEDAAGVNPDGSLGGVLAGLQRGMGHAAKGPAFDALVERIAQIFNIQQGDVDGINLAATPSNAHLVDYRDAARMWYEGTPHWPNRWPQSDLARFLDVAPVDLPLAVYGAKPAWLCASLGAKRNVQYLFDVRLGWMQPPQFVVCTSEDNSWQANEYLNLSLNWIGDTQVRLSLAQQADDYYLNYSALNGMKLPYVPDSVNITLFGKMPMWLFVALGRAYSYTSSVMGEQAQTSV